MANHQPPAANISLAGLPVTQFGGNRAEAGCLSPHPSAAVGPAVDSPSQAAPQDHVQEEEWAARGKLRAC